MLRIALTSLLLATSLLAQTPAAKTPAVRTQVVVGTSQKRVNGGYTKEMSISPKVTVEGTSRIGPLPALDATMLIITMDTRAKYVSGQEAYKVHTSETLPLAEAPNGNPRPLAFEESSVTYDSYRDASNVGGAVYKYYVFGLLDPATKTIVDFQTNHMQLANFCKAHPEKRDELLKLGKGAKFPAEFK